jgi:hypothetical protein
MRNSHRVEVGWLDEVGGEDLEGSGFENETPDPMYSDGDSLAAFHSGAGKERSDVH